MGNEGKAVIVPCRPAAPHGLRPPHGGGRTGPGSQDLSQHPSQEQGTWRGTGAAPAPGFWNQAEMWACGQAQLAETHRHAEPSCEELEAGPDVVSLGLGLMDLGRMKQGSGPWAGCKEL